MQELFEMKKRTELKNSGFGVAGVVLIAAVVVVLGLIGWKLYDATKTKNNTGNTQQTSNTSTPSNSGTQTPSQSEVKYLDIKELGVKVKLDDKTSGITYSVAQSSTDEAVYIIDPAMKVLDQADQSCSGATAGMIGLLDRSKDATHWGETPIKVDNVKSFKVGDYYYLFRGPQAECSQSSDRSAQRASHEQDFVNVLSSIQAD